MHSLAWSLCMYRSDTLIVVFLFFFFQAEDGIRDKLVTGVQTCALPIWCGGRRGWRGLRPRARRPVARLRTAGRRRLRPAGHQLLCPIDQTCPGQRLRRIPDLYIPIRAGTNPRQQQQEHEPLGPGAASLAPARAPGRPLLLLLLEQPKRVCRRRTRPRRSGSRNLRRNRSHRLRRDLPRDVIRRARRWRRCWRRPWWRWLVGHEDRGSRGPCFHGFGLGRGGGGAAGRLGEGWLRVGGGGRAVT